MEKGAGIRDQDPPFQTLANTSRFAPCRIRIKMCVEMKEQAQEHYFGTIRAIPIPVQE